MWKISLAEILASPGHLISDYEMPLVQQDLWLELFWGFLNWALFGLEQENASALEKNTVFTFLLTRKPWVWEIPAYLSHAGLSLI